MDLHDPGKTNTIDRIRISVVYPYITLTDFEKNTIRAIPVPKAEIEPIGPYPADSVECVAEKLSGEY